MTDTIEEIRARHEDTSGGWMHGYCDIEDGEQAHADRATLLRALDAMAEENARMKADLQAIAFGSRIVANADNSLSHVNWTREQLVEYARAALKETGQ